MIDQELTLDELEQAKSAAWARHCEITSAKRRALQAVLEAAQKAMDKELADDLANYGRVVRDICARQVNLKSTGQ